MIELLRLFVLFLTALAVLIIAVALLIVALDEVGALDSIIEHFKNRKDNK